MSDAEAERIERLADDAQLETVSERQIAPGESTRPLVIAVVRNEAPRMREFLDHYRRLGARHFVIVDNGSADGTRALLEQQPDVDLFATDQPFDAARKHGWITRLIRRYGDRWYLLADADEHATFAGVERLQDVAIAAERAGRQRVRGVLLDMYGSGPIGAAARGAAQSLADAYPFFDPHGYVIKREVALTTCIGGPRRRVFSAVEADFAPQLTKYPLFRLRPGETIVSPHYIHPPMAGAADPCWIALLHYKFDMDGHARIDDAVERGQYWRESYEYRVYKAALERDPQLTFVDERSRKFQGPDDLVELGIIERVPRVAQRQLFRRISALVSGRKASKRTR